MGWGPGQRHPARRSWTAFNCVRCWRMPPPLSSADPCKGRHLLQWAALLLKVLPATIQLGTACKAWHGLVKHPDCSSSWVVADISEEFAFPVEKACNIIKCRLPYWSVHLSQCMGVYMQSLVLQAYPGVHPEKRLCPQPSASESVCRSA